MQRLIVCLLGTIGLISLAGCSGGGGSIVSPSPVSAQTGYSNASISGTYSLLLSVGSQGAGIGSFSADGNGKISAGTLKIVNYSSSCTVGFTGTYNLASNASGTATVTATETSGSSGCLGDWTQLTSGSFNVQAGASGASMLFATATPPGGGAVMLSGSAIKQ